MLELSRAALDRLVAHCVAERPNEGCGLLVGSVGGAVTDAVPTRNTEASAVVYAIDPAEHLAVDRAAQADGLDVVGAFHSHTHSEAYPSPTDVARAVDPSWHWVVVSLCDAEPAVRSFRIVGGVIDEEPVSVVER